MADETLRRNLDSAFDRGPDYPDPLLLSRTMAMLQAHDATAHRDGRWKGRQRSRLGWPRIGLRLAAALLMVVLVIAAVGVFLVAHRALTQTVPAGLAPPTHASPSWPPAGPVPAQLLGDWFLGPGAYQYLRAAIRSGTPSCPSPPTAANCFVKLTFTATTFRESFTAIGGSQDVGVGNVVVNNSEIDFFNDPGCGNLLPDNVGRYTWALTGGVLAFTLISDPCSSDQNVVTAGLASVTYRFWIVDNTTLVPAIYRGWRRTQSGLACTGICGE